MHQLARCTLLLRCSALSPLLPCCLQGNAPGKRKVGGNSKTRKWHKQLHRCGHCGRRQQQHVAAAAPPPSPQPLPGTSCITTTNNNTSAATHSCRGKFEERHIDQVWEDVRKPPQAVHDGKSGPLGTTAK